MTGAPFCAPLFGKMRLHDARCWMQSMSIWPTGLSILTSASAQADGASGPGCLAQSRFVSPARMRSNPTCKQNSLCGLCFSSYVLKPKTLFPKLYSAPGSLSRDSADLTGMVGQGFGWRAWTIRALGFRDYVFSYFSYSPTLIPMSPN